MKTIRILSTTAILLSLSCCTAFGAYRLQDETIDSMAIAPNDQDSSYSSLPALNQEKEVTTKGDTTYISFGKKKIRIIEKNGTTDVKITDKEEGDDEHLDWATDEECEDLFSDKKDTKPWQEFKGHWSGVEFGLCNYMTRSNSLQLPDEYDFMNLRTGRSWNINLNFAQQSVGFGSDRIGLVSGMGLEISNYHFTSDIPIAMIDGKIAPDSVNARDNRLKNRFQTTYLTVPLILEWQFTGGEYDDRSYLGVGVIGGVNLFANTLMKYVENGDKKKEKISGKGYFLPPVRYAFTARVGFKALKMYANYYPMSLFRKDKGPELYPLAAGLVLNF